MNRAFEFFEKDKAPQWEPRNEYFTFYQNLNKLKHSQEALAAGLEGGEMVVYPTESPDLLIFSREQGDSKVVVLTNLGKEAAALNFTGDKPAVDGMKNYFTSEAAALPGQLNAGEYIVFVK